MENTTILPTYTLMMYDQLDDGNYGSLHVFATNEPTALISKSIDEIEGAKGFVVNHFATIITVTLSNNERQSVVILPFNNTIVNLSK